MKSKVTFGLGHNNQPVIKAEITHTDDVRDIIAVQFKHGLGHESCIAVCRFLDSHQEFSVDAPRVMELRTISVIPEECKALAEQMSDDQMKNLVNAFTKELGERANQKTQ